jgi:thiamine biosynthesis lipoprotein ApbE
MDKLTIIAGLSGLLLVLLVVGNAVYENPEQRYESSRDDLMDTYVNIIIYHNDEDEAKEIMNEVYAEMERVSAIANRFNTSSEVSILNANGNISNPSPELLEMIRTSKEYSTITGGAFDITILPLLNLWDPYSGAGPYEIFTMEQSHSDSLDSATITEAIRDAFLSSDSQYTLAGDASVTVIQPGQEWTIQSGWVNYHIMNATGILSITVKEFWNANPATQLMVLNDTMQLVGSEKITVTDGSITLQDGMSITLDGMAKGYIVDSAIRVLKARGIDRALIDAGGDITTIGEKPEDEKWVIGLRNPEDKSESVTEFEVDGKAVATSGNYERFFNDTANVGNIIDPATGYSVYNASSATIIANNCTVADILATAIFVLGTTDGIALVDTLPDVEALMLDYQDPQKMYRSSGASTYEI